MGLTTRQDNTLNELFDKFALDPQKKRDKKTEEKAEAKKTDGKKQPKK